MFTAQHDVMSEEDLASAFEENEREYNINKIIGHIKRRVVTESDLDPDLICIECGEIIPIGRQKVVLSMHETCDYCVYCQEVNDKRDNIYN